MKTAEQADNSMLRYGLFGKLGLLSKRNFLGKINELVSDVSDEVIRIDYVRVETLLTNFTKSHFRAKTF